MVAYQNWAHAAVGFENRFLHILMFAFCIIKMANSQAIAVRLAGPAYTADSTRIFFSSIFILFLISQND